MSSNHVVIESHFLARLLSRGGEAELLSAADRLDIMDLIHTFGWCIDSEVHDVLAHIVTEDFVLDLASQRIEGRDNFIKWLKEKKHFSGLRHQNTNLLMRSIDLTNAVGVSHLSMIKVAAKDDGNQASGERSTGSNSAVGQGGSNQYASIQGVANQGATNQGATNQGATNRGATNQGATNQGATNQGATNQGVANQDATNQDATNQGTEKSSSNHPKGSQALTSASANFVPVNTHPTRPAHGQAAPGELKDGGPALVVQGICTDVLKSEKDIWKIAKRTVDQIAVDSSFVSDPAARSKFGLTAKERNSGAEQSSTK